MHPQVAEKSNLGAETTIAEVIIVRRRDCLSVKGSFLTGSSLCLLFTQPIVDISIMYPLCVFMTSTSMLMNEP